MWWDSLRLALFHTEPFAGVHFQCVDIPDHPMIWVEQVSKYVVAGAT